LVLHCRLAYHDEIFIHIIPAWQFSASKDKRILASNNLGNGINSEILAFGKPLFQMA
jgi:hypothetical protein